MISQYPRRSIRRLCDGRCIGSCVGMVLSVALMGCQNGPPSVPNVMTVRYEVHGAVNETQHLASPADANHYCSTSALPWGHTPSGVEIPQGPPTFRLDFDLQAGATEPGLSLAAFDYTRGMTSHSDPADDWIEVSAGGKHWIGHGLQRDPAFDISFTFAADGQGGAFVAHALHAGPIGTSPDMASAVDVSGNWTCASPPTAN